MLSDWVVCKGPWDVFKGSLAVVLGPPTSHTCCWEFFCGFFFSSSSASLLLFIFYLSFLLVNNFPTDHQIIYRTKPSGNKNPVTAAIDIEDKTVLKHFLQSSHTHLHINTCKRVSLLSWVLPGKLANWKLSDTIVIYSFYPFSDNFTAIGLPRTAASFLPTGLSTLHDWCTELN